MRLTIGENEGAILEVLNGKGELKAIEIVELTHLPSGSIGTTLLRMVEKGWVSFREIDTEHKTLPAKVTRLYLITDLGFAAQRAWNIYSRAPGAQ